MSHALYLILMIGARANDFCIFHHIAGDRAAWAVPVAVFILILQKALDDGIDHFLIRI